PVLRLSWLNEIFSLSEVAGYSATGQVTRDRRRKPFQLARGAMLRRTPVSRRLGLKTNKTAWFRHPAPGGHHFLASAFLPTRHLFLLCSNEDYERSTRELAHAD